MAILSVKLCFENLITTCNKRSHKGTYKVGKAIIGNILIYLQAVIYY